jgi:calcium-dependent protein kinase
LTKDELLEGWNEAFNTHISDEEINVIFNNIDTNKNGKIDYSEFIMACMDRKKMLNEERLTKVFNMFDKDGSGEIDASEIKKIFDNNSEN